MGHDDLVELSDGGAADANFAVDGVEGHHVVLQHGQQVVRILAGATRGNGGRFEALLDEDPGLGFVQPVQALDDAGLDGPMAVESPSHHTEIGYLQ